MGCFLMKCWGLFSLILKRVGSHSMRWDCDVQQNIDDNCGIGLQLVLRCFFLSKSSITLTIKRDLAFEWSRVATCQLPTRGQDAWYLSGVSALGVVVDQ
jgi:hypothetical protein